VETEIDGAEDAALARVLDELRRVADQLPNGRLTPRRWSQATAWSRATASRTAALVSATARMEWASPTTTATTSRTPNETVKTVFRVTWDLLISGLVGGTGRPSSGIAPSK